MDQMGIDRHETRATESRYNRVARVYDLMETFVEPIYRPWRTRAWNLIEGKRILEVGVGTGKNMAYYPPGRHIVAVDLSLGMLARAERRARALGADVSLQQMDVQKLDFADSSFDSAFASFVFCSVPDPTQGLEGLARVVRPGGSIVLLEHVRSANRLLGALMKLFDPVVVRLVGAHIARNTVDTVRASPLEIDAVHDLDPADVFKLIVARSS